MIAESTLASWSKNSRNSSSASRTKDFARPDRDGVFSQEFTKQGPSCQGQHSGQKTGGKKAGCFPASLHFPYRSHLSTDMQQFKMPRVIAAGQRPRAALTAASPVAAILGRDPASQGSMLCGLSSTTRPQPSPVFASLRILPMIFVLHLEGERKVLEKLADIRAFGRVSGAHIGVHVAPP